MYQRTFLALVLALSFTATDALAQASASETATVSADVIAALTISKDQDLQFGEIASGTAKTIAVTDAGATTFSIGGEASTTVTLTYTAPTTLTDGGNAMPFTADVQANTTDDAATASALSSGDSQTLSASSALYVYLGGTADASASPPMGSYSNTFSISVEY